MQELGQVLIKALESDFGWIVILVVLYFLMQKVKDIVEDVRSVLTELPNILTRLALVEDNIRRDLQNGLKSTIDKVHTSVIKIETRCKLLHGDGNDG